MRNLTLTCKNHPELRWQTKEGAIELGAAIPGSPANYNGRWNLYFVGVAIAATKDYAVTGLDGSAVEECNCPTRTLLIAPEDITCYVWDDNLDTTDEGLAFLMEKKRGQYAGAYDLRGVHSTKPGTNPHVAVA